MDDIQCKSVFLKEQRDRNYSHFSFSRSDKESIVNLKQILAVCLSILHFACGGILSGFASIIVAQVDENSVFGVTPSEASWISSIVIIPMAPGSLLAGYLLHKMPRKRIFVMLVITEAIGWLIIYLSTSVAMVLTGRVITGMSCAMGASILPSFIGEISHPSNRGVFLYMLIFGLSLGVLMIHCIGAFFTWQVCALMTSFLLISFLGVIIYLKETYAWYLKNNHHEEARKSFHWYRGEGEEARREFERLISHQDDNSCRNYTSEEMRKLYGSKLLLMPVCITMVGMATMHFSGAKTIMFHSISIVSKVIPTLNQYASTIIIDFIRAVVTFFVAFLVKRFPVRKLFIFSGVGSALSHFSFAMFHHYSDRDESLFAILSLLSLLAFIVFSSFGILPITWTLPGEIIPLIVRSTGTAISCFFYFTTFFVVVKLTPDLLEICGISGGFFVFGVCIAIGTCIMYFIMPETKDKTLKDIEELFR